MFGLLTKALGISSAVLLVLLVVQSARLGHAKHDQWDRATCPAGDKACKGVKWKAEVGELRPALEARTRDLATCKLNEANLSGALTEQNASIDALKTQGASQTAASAKAVRDIAKTADGLQRASLAVLSAKPGPDQCVSADALILANLRGPQ